VGTQKEVREKERGDEQARRRRGMGTL